MSQEIEILARVVGSDNSLPDEAARWVLALRFDEADVDRINSLAEKAAKGELSEDEQSLLYAYLFVGAAVNLMQSKARRQLQKRADRL